MNGSLRRCVFPDIGQFTRRFEFLLVLGDDLVKHNGNFVVVVVVWDGDISKGEGFCCNVVKLRRQGGLDVVLEIIDSVA